MPLVGARLRVFVEREGHARVPVRYKDSHGFGLGNWVIRQRMNHREGILDATRAHRLEKLPGGHGMRV